MNDTPGWASPGSAPSDGQQPGASAPADRPGPTEPADQPRPDTTDSGPKWSKEQPPPAQWSAPTGPQGPGQTPPPPPPPGPGWGGNPPALRAATAAPEDTAATARPVATPAGEATGAVPRPPPSPA